MATKGRRKATNALRHLGKRRDMGSPGTHISGPDPKQTRKNVDVRLKMPWTVDPGVAKSLMARKQYDSLDS